MLTWHYSTYSRGAKRILHERGGHFYAFDMPCYYCTFQSYMLCKNWKRTGFTRSPKQLLQLSFQVSRVRLWWQSFMTSAASTANIPVSPLKLRSVTLLAFKLRHDGAVSVEVVKSFQVGTWRKCENTVLFADETGVTRQNPRNVFQQQTLQPRSMWLLICVHRTVPCR